LIACSPTPKVVGQQNSRGAGKLIEGTSALFLNYPAINIKSVTYEYRAEIHDIALKQMNEIKVIVLEECLN
jgi:DNA-binding cell septation regulator SpoVG